MNALVALPQPGEAVSLTRYETMREAVALVTTADEAKAWADKAAAAAFYARQIRDREVETWLTEIKRRAEYRLGEMLLTIEPAKGGRPKTHGSASTVPPSVRGTVLAAGLDPATATRLMHLAGPRDEDLQAVGRAAAEVYYARAREAQEPATRVGLQAHITAAVQAAMGPTEIRRAYKGLVRQDLAAKAERRAAREVRLGERARAESARLGTKLYPVLYADPPWDYATWSAETGKGRAAANHYPTMSLAQLEAMTVPAADSATLFLWVTSPLALAVAPMIAAWGFTYRTQIAWVKPHRGTGLLVRNQHELLYWCARGPDPVAPALGTQTSSVIAAAPATRRHSLKPAVFAELIERFYPTCERLELFARERRPGWDAWGNEVELDGADDMPNDGGAARPVAGPDAGADEGTP